jgi:hypothetical protein
MKDIYKDIFKETYFSTLKTVEKKDRKEFLETEKKR